MLISTFRPIYLQRKHFSFIPCSLPSHVCLKNPWPRVGSSPLEVYTSLAQLFELCYSACRHGALSFPKSAISQIITPTKKQRSSPSCLILNNDQFLVFLVPGPFTSPHHMTTTIMHPATSRCYFPSLLRTTGWAHVTKDDHIFCILLDCTIRVAHFCQEFEWSNLAIFCVINISNNIIADATWCYLFTTLSLSWPANNCFFWGVFCIDRSRDA